jgi:hypothetical protein
MSSCVHDAELAPGVAGLNDQILVPVDVEQSPAYTISDPLSAMEGTKAVLLFFKKGRLEDRVSGDNEEAFNMPEMLRPSKLTEPS